MYRINEMGRGEMYENSVSGEAMNALLENENNEGLTEMSCRAGGFVDKSSSGKWLPSA